MKNDTIKYWFVVTEVLLQTNNSLIPISRSVTVKAVFINKEIIEQNVKDSIKGNISVNSVCIVSYKEMTKEQHTIYNT